MLLVRQLTKFLEKTFVKIITTTSLTLTYLIGIGITSVVGKIVGKNFLPSDKKSSWKKADYKINVKKMF